MRCLPLGWTSLQRRSAGPFLCVSALAALALATAAVAGVEAASPGTGAAIGGPSSTRCTAPGRTRTELVNVSTEGVQADARVLRATVSANGRFVAFSSAATNLVAGDTNGFADVFVRDLRLRTTTRVSVSSTGAEGDAASYFPSISADGRVVAFRSMAKNLVEGDNNRVEDVFVHDRATGRTERVSVGWQSQEANAPSITSSISADGTVIAFSSSATNLVPRDRNDVRDVFVRDTLRQ